MAHWVFAYGSLMWRPDFPHAHSARATLQGYHRSLCHYSDHYRGTAEKLGLVFGLDEGGSCEGLAYHVSAADWPQAYAILHAREMINHTYLEMFQPVIVDGVAQPVSALCYVMNRDNDHYAGVLPLDGIIRHIRQGVGVMGRCDDYVRSTHAKLRELGIEDAALNRIVAALT
jgi:glutathione-specific gamma-glutamylcyclotransferase